MLLFVASFLLPSVETLPLHVHKCGRRTLGTVFTPVHNRRTTASIITRDETNGRIFFLPPLHPAFDETCHRVARGFRCDDLPPWTHAAQRLPERRIRALLYEHCLRTEPGRCELTVPLQHLRSSSSRIVEASKAASSDDNSCVLYEHELRRMTTCDHSGTFR